MGSSRFPNKVIERYKGKPLIVHIIEECEKTKLPVVLAVPEAERDIWGVESWKNIFYGASNDVISRYYHCVKEYGFDPVIRVTGDAKDIHHELILQQLENYKKYGHICHGNFCEVFSFKQLEDYYLHDKRPQTREHVTLGMIQDQTVDWEIDLN